MHTIEFGYCVPVHWDVNRKDNFTWFEKSCPDHVSPQVLIDIENYREVEQNKHIVVPAFANLESDGTIEHELNHGAPPYNILVIFGTFTMGAFVRFIFLDTKVPYTVVVFLIGIGYGSLGKLESMKDKMERYEELAFMNPHMIFYIFLPVLIFESAFAMEIPVFKKVVWQCILLAGPGLIVASTITGLVAHTVFTDYNWTFPACLLFGTILSATDPVAVVALLKDLGAPTLISTMIEGESLFNDGTAIVFFTVLKSSVERGSGGGCEAVWDTCYDQCECTVDCKIPLNVIEIIIEFCKVSFGGPLVGLIFGVITVNGVGRVFNDSLIEITATLCSAYITFFVCEGFLHVSGVLGLVVLGCYMSYYKQCISPEVEHSLHEFWTMTVYLTNTCIFALAGMIVALKAFDTITGRDVVYLLIIYVTINVVRTFVLILFTPILRRFEYKLDLGSSALVAWGGLRGAVGLALALIIQADDRVVVENVREKFIFHVAGIVILTLLVNGVTTQNLVKYFELDAVSERRKKIMRDTYSKLQEFRKAEIQNLGWNEMTATAYYDCNWEFVNKYTDPGTLLPSKSQNPYMSKQEKVFDPHDDMIEEKLWEEGLSAYYNSIHSGIHKQYAYGQLGSSVARDLEHLAFTSYDKAGMMEVDSARLFFQDTFAIKRLAGTSLGRRMSLWKLVHALEVSLGFAHCHELAKTHVRQLCDRAVASRIETHCKRVITETRKIINENTAMMPSISVSIKTKHAARSILNSMKHATQKMAKEGRLDEGDRMALVPMIESQMKKLKNKFPNDLLLPSDSQAVHLAKWFEECDDHGQSMINNAFAGSSQTIEAKKNLSEMLKGGIFLIVGGILEVRVGRKIFKYGSGYTVGLQRLLTGSSRFDDVVTTSECHVIYLSPEKLELLLENKSVSNSLWKQCGVQAARILMALDPLFEKWDEKSIRKVAEKGGCGHLQDPTGFAWDAVNQFKLHPETTYTVLLRGRCFEYEGEFPLRFPELIPNTFKFASFTNHAVTFEIEAPDNASTRAKRRWGRLRSKTKSIVLWSSLRSVYWQKVSLALAFGRALPDLKTPPPEEITNPKILSPVSEVELPPAIEIKEPAPLPPTPRMNPLAPYSTGVPTTASDRQRVGRIQRMEKESKLLKQKIEQLEMDKRKNQQLQRPSSRSDTRPKHDFPAIPDETYYSSNGRRHLAVQSNTPQQRPHQPPSTYHERPKWQPEEHPSLPERKLGSHVPAQSVHPYDPWKDDDDANDVGNTSDFFSKSSKRTNGDTNTNRSRARPAYSQTSDKFGSSNSDEKFGAFEYLSNGEQSRAGQGSFTPSRVSEAPPISSKRSSKPTSPYTPGSAAPSAERAKRINLPATPDFTQLVESARTKQKAVI
eukprot:TRINITY_DN12092_c0_g1_i1.p1 TRINITY_DN12092_c0_g1~~TRINITY_DN12092_c0_g1_i1.p1  ORF type:complete len:1372 (+),score=173.86 TRINITY_DN12092_c0_g1_i1:419-4534(+)